MCTGSTKGSDFLTFFIQQNLLQYIHFFLQRYFLLMRRRLEQCLPPLCVYPDAHTLPSIGTLSMVGIVITVSHHNIVIIWKTHRQTHPSPTKYTNRNTIEGDKHQLQCVLNSINSFAVKVTDHNTQCLNKMS